MRLQDQIFEFGSLDDYKLAIKEINKSNVVVDEKPTSVTLEQLFKGPIKLKSSTRVKGFSILEYVNEKGEIEINSKIYRISFVKDGVKFVLKGYVKSQMQRSDKKLTSEEAASLGKLISESTPIEESKVAAADSTTSSKAKNSDSSPEANAEDEAGVKVELFNPENYTQDKDEMILDGYKEYTPEAKDNIRVLIKDEDVKLVELKKDDYDLLNADDFDIELDDKKYTFTIKPTK